MSKIERSFLCLHGHFSQPPRGNPIDDRVGEEPDAAPYRNWNDHITETSYRPNAERGNFRYISYSFSESMLRWIEGHYPDVYAPIVEADKQTAAQHAPGGNALATAYNHSILPLARKRDKRTQIAWGIAAFESRYGRKPLGFWLPEMAVDLETLRLLVEAGIEYTLLAEKQVLNLPAGGGAGPYKVQVAPGKTIAVFVRNDDLSSQISFNVHNLGGAGFWCQHVLGPARKNVGPLLLLAMAGETFGHHFAGEEEFLYWLMNNEAYRVGYQVITLDQFYLAHKPTQTIQIEELSSWDRHKGLSHWTTGYADQYQDTTWKGALRRALDNAASEVDQVYEDLLRSTGLNPWILRTEYAEVLIGKTEVDAFVSQKAPMLAADEHEKLKKLLRAQLLTQRMYNSYTFTDNNLAGRQPRYAVACAAAALVLAQQTTGRDLGDRFTSDMAVVRSGSVSVTGADILRDVMTDYDLHFMDD